MNNISKWFQLLILLMLNLSLVSPQRWDGNILYDLEGSDAPFLALANLWTFSSLKDSSKRVSPCGGVDLLGGYNIMGGTLNQYMQRQYNGVPAHNQVRLLFTMYAIDSWATVENDHFNVKIGNTQVTGWTLDHVAGGPFTNLCGVSYWPDIPPYQVIYQVPHVGVEGSSVTITIINMANEASDNESFGIRDVMVTFKTVDSPTQQFCAASTSSIPITATRCTCFDHQYMSPAGSGFCYDCNSLCKTCSGPNSNQCLSCVDGKYLSGSLSKICATCDSSCATCDGPLDSNCLTCNPGYYLVDGFCVLYCNEPFYSQIVGANNVCKTPCPGQFAWKDGLTCTNDCSSPYSSVIVKSLKACVCFNEVGPGQDCYACDSSCSTCDGQQVTQCLTCFDRFYVAVIDDDDDVDGTCESCDSSCLTCSGPSDYECLSCDPGFFLFNGTCSSCEPSCVTCDGPSANECLSCYSHFYLTAQNSCDSCDNSCGECTGPSENQCITCATGNYLYNNNTCIASCQSPFYITEDAINQYCDTPCSGKYATEDGVCISGCDALSTRYELYNLKACYCDLPYYRYWNQSCLSTCDTPLQSTTSGLVNYCTCPYYLYKNNTCITSCNSPFYITQDASNKYCDTTCPTSYAMENTVCSAVCDGVSTLSEFYTLKSCFCNSPNYRYWNDSCLTTCDFPLKTRTSGSLNYCDFPCAPNEYLYWNQSCSVNCDLPYMPIRVAGNLYCRNLGCKGMKINFIKATVTGFQYTLQLAPSTCDLPAYYVDDMVNTNADAKELLKDFHFDVTRTEAATYFLDLTLGASVLQDTTLNLNFTGLSGKMIVFSKLTSSNFVQQLAKLMETASTAVTFATAVTFVSVVVFKSASSVWGFVGFQQLMNYYKYINIPYPYQIEMLFKLGGATDFGSLPNVLDMATNSTYETLSKNEDLMTQLDPPRKFVNYEEDSFFIKAGGSLFLLNMLLLVLLLICNFIKKTEVGEHKHFLKVDGMIRWNFTLRSFLAASLPFIVSIFLQLRISRNYESYVTISTALAAFAVLYCVLISLFMVYILKQKNIKEVKEESFEKVYGTLVDALALERESGKYYYMMVFLRNILIAFMVVFVEKVPLLQILSLAFFNIGFAYYIKKNVRFENPKETRKTIITETMLVPMNLLICFLTKNPASEKYYDVVGWIISAVIAVIFLNEMYFVVLIQIDVIKTLYKKLKPKLAEWRAKHKNKNKVAPEKDQISFAQVPPEQEPISGFDLTDPKLQSIEAADKSLSPIKETGIFESPLNKGKDRKVFPISESPASGLFEDQKKRVFKRKTQLLVEFDSDLHSRFYSFAQTPTTQLNTPSVIIPIIGGVETAFDSSEKVTSPINRLKTTNQVEEKDNLLEFS